MSRPWVLISGASSGFGKASAKQLAKEGWNVLLTSRREERLEEVAQTCRSMGATVHIEARWLDSCRMCSQHTVRMAFDAFLDRQSKTFIDDGSDSVS